MPAEADWVSITRTRPFPSSSAAINALSNVPDLLAELCRETTRSYAARSRQPVVDDQHLCIGSLAEPDRVGAVRGGAHDLDLGVEPEQELDRLPEDLVVLD